MFIVSKILVEISLSCDPKSEEYNGNSDEGKLKIPGIFTFIFRCLFRAPHFRFRDDAKSHEDKNVVASGATTTAGVPTIKYQHNCKSKSTGV